MFEWVDRDVLVDVAINAVPVVILAYFVGVTLVWVPWDIGPLTFVMTHVLTVVPIVVLTVATYYGARAIERDARRREDSVGGKEHGRLPSPSVLDSVYVPGGAFAFLLLTVGLTLVAAVAYLLLFTDVALPL